MSATSSAGSLDGLKRVIKDVWGYDTLRPLQEQAMRADLKGRDSLVVMPTGGGKSLCYQAPAVLRGAGHTTVVLSPLIALMKDQVDGLQACGVPAIQIDSSQSLEEQRAYRQHILQGAVRLLFISPERLVNTEFYKVLQEIKVRTFAIDEAHCISHWGHDFRPEYRLLSGIRDRFPGASVHAYTATATEQVRRDIATQLALQQPELLVGNFDRPNLTYRVLPRHDRSKQVLQVLERHPGEAGIIYAPTRREVEDLTDILRQHGHNVRRYHAGLDTNERKQAQEAFASEQCDLIVATVAFGMGIDRSNIRFVLHTGMPKSLEHYQQETGRAGRDGLEAECVLLHSGGDFYTWKSVLEKSVQEAEGEVDPSFLTGALQHLNDIDRFARGAACRHRSLVEYFGQTYEAESCSACDVCLGDTAELPDALVVARKILSCVARVEERFGIGHVISVLRGEDDEKVRKFRHDKLTTYGLLKDRRVVDIRDWIYQLISQKALMQHDLVLSDGRKVPLLKLTPGSWEVMRGERAVRLLQLVRRKKGEKAERSKAEVVSWEGVDRGLYDELAQLRKRLTQERHLAGAYLVFGDRTLREMARVRPLTLEGMGRLYGVGEAKLRDYGDVFLEVIRGYSQRHGLTAEASARGAGVSPADLQAGRLHHEAEQAGRLHHEDTPEPAPAPPQRDETKPLANTLEVAQKILSCVAKVKGPFDAEHVGRVLRGRDTEKVRELGHQNLSTYGLLKQSSAGQIHDWIAQLVEQQLLVAEGAPKPVLRLNDASWAVMRGQKAVRLVPLVGEEEDEPDTTMWEGVDRELFEALADLRDRLAEEGNVLPRAVVRDWILRELARVRPSSLERMRFISGLGDATLTAYGSQLLHRIVEYCRFKAVPMDQPSRPGKPVAPLPRTARTRENEERAFPLYRKGTTVDEVIRQTEWSRSKATDYLCEFIRQTRPAAIDTWVPVEVQQLIAHAARQVGTDKLKPIYLLLGEKIAYDEIRIVLSHLLSAAG